MKQPLAHIPQDRAYSEAMKRCKTRPANRPLREELLIGEGREADAGLARLELRALNSLQFPLLRASTTP